jgi:hypothetical protein
MDLWVRSDYTHACIESLVRRGLLHMRTEANEWLLPDSRDSLLPPNGYVVSFAHFH